MNRTALLQIYGMGQLRVTFRRCFGHRLMLQSYEIVQISQNFHITAEVDALISMWEPNGGEGFLLMSNPFGVQKFPQIHFFLWLLWHNRVITRDNLVKK
jgi:hypothetical protein